MCIFKSVWFNFLLFFPRISVGSGAERQVNGHGELDARTNFVGMSVPDKIVVAGKYGQFNF